jgi:alkylation response protein AidB-like acyl-CoA dehydrogenase
MSLPGSTPRSHHANAAARADQTEPGIDHREHQFAALRHDCALGRLGRAQSIFGGTTEIMKEIIGRGLGL